ncbi:outer membrane beta-barrel protein, partial [Salmonella enterica]|uniref:outer membrane beta-barrel protein n=1 Tax=Salmonella enterica TaxID=28901 RepID=UPI0015CC6D89
YSYTRNIIQETIDLSNNIYISRPANIGKSSVLGLGVDVSVKPTKWWSLLGYAEVQNRKYQDFIYGYALDTSALYFGLNITNQFTMG